MLTILCFNIKVKYCQLLVKQGFTNMKKPISVEIPEKLASHLDELAKKSGRKKNLLIAASLNNFLSTPEADQEKVIRKYLSAYNK